MVLWFYVCSLGQWNSEIPHYLPLTILWMIRGYSFGDADERADNLDWALIWMEKKNSFLVDSAGKGKKGFLGRLYTLLVRK